MAAASTLNQMFLFIISPRTTIPGDGGQARELAACGQSPLPLLNIGQV
jgi:hypothetical protein